MNKLYPLTALALACAALPQAYADNKLEEMIVTSSRVPMPLRQIGTSVSSIDAAEIEQRGFSSLYDVLRSQPAVAVSNQGGAGKITSLRIRGEEGYRTLVLLDGIDLSDTGGIQVSPRMEHLMSAGIQRVEILRGPQGLMYGADAGGVINISTRAPREGMAASVSAEGGRYGTRQLAADVGGGNSKVDFNLSASDYQSDGYNSLTTDDILRDDDGYENTTLHGRLGWNISEDLRLQVVGRDITSENEYDRCYDTNFDITHACHDDFDQSSWRVAADYQHGGFTHELSYNSNETEREGFAEGQSSYFANGELESTSYTGSFTASEVLKLVYGVDLKTEAIDSSEYNNERDQDGYYLEYQGGFDSSLFVTAGVRYDDNEDFGDYTSYRVSGAYLLDLDNSELKLKASYGTGFRAPSLYEIATNNSPWAYPPASDTELKEEESKGYDLGVSWFLNNGTVLEAVYFDQTVTDGIDYDYDFYSGYIQDLGDSDSRGIELIGEISFADSFTLQGNYTYNDTEDADGNQRARRPEQLFTLGLDWRTLDQRLVLGLNVRGAYDAVNTDGEKLDDYEVVDLNASFAITERLSVYGRVENLLDEDYEEVPTYNTSGAAAYAGVRYSFQD
jgi:vitamin B12 transporter